MNPHPPEQALADRPFRRWGTLLLLILAFSPLCLARTPTTISEDVAILLFLAVAALWWRQGWRLHTSARLILELLVLGFLFAVVWRSQIDLISEWGRLIYWPVICLVVAACLAGGACRERSTPLRLLPLALLISLVGLVFSQLILPATLPDRPYRYRPELFVPGGLIILGLFSIAAIVRSVRYTARRKLYIAVPLLFGLIAGARGWYRDASTLLTWWNASRLERSIRAWHGEQAKEVPQKTRRLYSQVLNTLEESGGQLARKTRLDLLLRYRLAETAKRMHQPARMLAALPPGTWTTTQASRLLTDLWTASDLDRLRRKARDRPYLLGLRAPVEPDPWETRPDSEWIPQGPSSERLAWRERLAFHVDLYVDHQIVSDGSVVWLLDRWGRVFRGEKEPAVEPVWQNAQDQWGAAKLLLISHLERVWEAAPGEGRADAVDLEVWEKTVAVAFANGEVRVAADRATWFPQPWRMPLHPGHRLVDIERHPEHVGAVSLSSYGQFSVVGSIPEAFPVPEKPLFPWAAAVDLEISEDGLGWYVLDTFGVIHAQSGGNPLPLAAQVPDSPFSTIKAPNAPYWPEEMALDIELDPWGRGICLLNRLGEAWTIADPPFREVYPRFEDEPTKGLGVSLAVRQDGAIVLLYASGNLVVVQ